MTDTFKPLGAIAAQVVRKVAPRPRIVTSNIYPPIPDRRFDWSATFDGYEPGGPIGFGRTEQEAIDDLLLGA